MIQDTTNRIGGRRQVAVMRAARPVMLTAVLLLAGCGGGAGPLSGTASRPGAAAPAALPQDPVAAFAAQSRPGATGRITLADGQPANVRLVRSYAAASGRECREVLVGAGMAERSQLVCATEGGSWAPARPLLRGGGAARP